MGKDKNDNCSSNRDIKYIRRVRINVADSSFKTDKTNMKVKIYDLLLNRTD